MKTFEFEVFHVFSLVFQILFLILFNDKKILANKLSRQQIKIELEVF